MPEELISDFRFEVGEIDVDFGDTDFEVAPDGDEPDDEAGDAECLWYIHDGERDPGVHGLYFSGDRLAFMMLLIFKNLYSQN